MAGGPREAGMTPRGPRQEFRSLHKTIGAVLGESDRRSSDTRRLVGRCRWEGGGVVVWIDARADPREPLTPDARSGARTASETREGLLKDYQGMQVAQRSLDRNRPVTHDPLRLSHGGLRGDGGLEDALVQIRSVEVHNFEDHEDPDGCKGNENYQPPGRGSRGKEPPHFTSRQFWFWINDANLGSYRLCTTPPGPPTTSLAVVMTPGPPGRFLFLTLWELIRNALR
jgi:hypothetical protein